MVLLVLVGGYFLVNKEKNESENQTIKIGAVLSLSGDAAQDGENIKNGLELAKTDLKASGVDVEIFYQDDKTNPKDTVSAINFLGSKGVDAIVGPTWSFLGDAGVPVADKLGIVLLQPANTSEYVGAKSPFAFFGVVRVDRISSALASWLKENNIKTIAVVKNQGAWGDAIGRAVEKATMEAGAKIVLTESITYGSEASAMPTVIAKIKNAKADLVFTEIDDDSGIVVMLKKFTEQNITAPIMSVTTSIGRVLNENVILNLKNELYVIAPATSKDFEKKFEGIYNKQSGAYADRGYDALMVLVDAIQKKGTTPLNEYLRNKTNYSGFAGQYNFDENGDIQGGDWLIKKVK